MKSIHIVSAQLYDGQMGQRIVMFMAKNAESEKSNILLGSNSRYFLDLWKKERRGGPG